MKRSYLLSLLETYAPATSEEIAAKEKFITFVQDNPDCFERSLSSGHVTASSWLINKTNTHALLTHHAKLNAWLQLGGHCDGDHDVLRVAIKEAQEESGINKIIPISTSIFDIDAHLIPANAKDEAHYHYDVRFLLQVISDEDFVKSDESHDLLWIEKNLNTLPTQTESILRMFNKWLKHV